MFVSVFIKECRDLVTGHTTASVLGPVVGPETLNPMRRERQVPARGDRLLH